MAAEEYSDVRARRALRTLIVQHLRDEGLATSLVSEVEQALRKAPITDDGPRSALLSALLSDCWQPPEEIPRLAGVAPVLSQASGRAPKVSVDDNDDVAMLAASANSTHHTERSGFCMRLAPPIIVVMFSLIYLPCITYSEWYIDELFAAVRNADARGESTLWQVLSHDFWGNALWDGQWTHKSYRPLVILSYALQYRFNHGIIKPQALRAFNVALHTVNCIFLYMLGRRQGAPRRWACLSACLFAVHPVHAENIVYLVGRADALATHCWLLTLLAWPMSGARETRSVSKILRVTLVTSLAMVGGLCKESGFVVLFQLAVGEFMSRRPVQRSTPLLVSFCAVYMWRSWFTQGTSAGFSYVDTPVQYHDNRIVRTFTYLYFHSKYAQLLVFPWSLSWDYSYDALPLLRATWQDARFLGVLTTYLGIAALASKGFHWRSRRFLFGLSNVLVPFVPASNLFFVVGTTIGERLLYPCNAGGALLVAAFGGRQEAANAAKPRTQRRHFKFFLCILLLSVYTYRCAIRLHQWSSRDHLFGPDLVSYPRSAKAQHQYATILHRVNRFEEARQHFETSLSIFSDNALSEYCIAQILLETGKPQEALARLEHILQGHGLGFGTFNIYALYVDYGFTLMMLRRFEEAIPHLLHGLKLNEDVPHGLNALGYSYVSLGRLQDAIAAFERGLYYEPENPYLMNNLGASLMMAGQVDRGGSFLSKAAVADPSVPTFHYNMQLLQVMVQTQTWPREQFGLELFFNRGN